MSAADRAAAYSVKDSPLRGPAVWTLQGEVLIRRTGASETRWPLSSLTRMTLRRQANRYGPALCTAQLRFGRRAVGFGSLGWQGLGRPTDQTAAFSAFVRALAAAAATAAPRARFQIGGRASAPAGLYWVAGMLALAVVAIAASAISAGFVAIGLDWGARLTFVLILVFAVTPWLPGPAVAVFDPRAIPRDLAP